MPWGVDTRHSSPVLTHITRHRFCRAVIANHGGGYQYRLCRKIKGYEVTEECFQECALPHCEGIQEIVGRSPHGL